MHVFLANECESNTEATATVEGLIQVIWAHRLSISVFNAALWDLRLSWCKGLNDNGGTWTRFEAFNLNALSEEYSDCLFIAKRGLIDDALATPEVVKVALADPLVKCRCVELVFEVHFHALVRLHILV